MGSEEETGKKENGYFDTCGVGQEFGGFVECMSDECFCVKTNFTTKFT